MHFVRTKQPEKARKILEESTEKIALSEPAKHFALAQGFELLGDVPAAQEQYRATIAADAKHIEARLRLAMTLVSSDVAAARQQFEQVLEIEPQNAQARRYLASLWAASGSEEDWDKAEGLLASAGTRNEAVGDDRVRAILQSRRGRDRVERIKNSRAARQILESGFGQGDSKFIDLDRMLLAGLHEQEAAMLSDTAEAKQAVLSARDALRPLVDRSKPPVNYLVVYIQFLLRTVQRMDSSVISTKDSADLRAVLMSDARLRIEELEDLLAEELKKSHAEESAIEHRFALVALRARMLSIDGQQEQARNQLQAFASEHLEGNGEQPERAKVLLQLGNLSAILGFNKEAEGWYRQLLEIVPNSYILLAKSLADQKRVEEAVDVCLHAASTRPAAEVATVLVQLLSSSEANPELQERVRPFITSALNANRDDVTLLMSIAVRHVTENNYDEAIKLFRRVLELQPNHTLALINLATLLAERRDQLAEARKLAEQAIKVAGRSPALLDTLGTIDIRAGKYDDAVESLEQAVAGVTEDPRFYFHLAVAYQRAGRDDEVVKQLESARRYGLDDAILTDGDRELLANLERELKK
jgi:tetratricopeptide (TPR) repeat protein